MNVIITQKMNKYGFASIIASIIFCEKTIGNHISIQELISKLHNSFWEKNGYMSSNMNRAKMIYDLCEKYNIPNNGYNDIHKNFRELFRPDDEISEIENLI